MVTFFHQACFIWVAIKQQKRYLKVWNGLVGFSLFYFCHFYFIDLYAFLYSTSVYTRTIFSKWFLCKQLIKRVKWPSKNGATTADALGLHRAPLAANISKLPQEKLKSWCLGDGYALLAKENWSYPLNIVDLTSNLQANHLGADVVLFKGPKGQNKQWGN